MQRIDLTSVVRKWAVWQRVAWACMIAVGMSACECSDAEIASQKAHVLAWKREASRDWVPGQVVAIDLAARTFSLVADPSSLADPHAIHLVSHGNQAKLDGPIIFVGIVPKQKKVCYAAVLQAKRLIDESYGSTSELIAALNRTSTGLTYNEDADFRWVGMKSRVRWALREAAIRPEEVTVGILNRVSKTAGGADSAITIRMELEILRFCSPLGNSGAEFESAGVRQFALASSAAGAARKP